MLILPFTDVILKCIEQLQPDKVEEPEKDARMTTEQVKELGEALSILSAKSSVLKERQELRALMEENLQADEVRTVVFSVPEFCKLTHVLNRTHNHRLAPSPSAFVPC